MLKAVIGLCVGFVVSVCAAASPPDAFVRVPRLDQHAAPGCRFADAPWDKAACIAGFIKLGGETLAAHPTRVYVFRDRTSLWLGFRCEGVPAAKLKTEAKDRDGTVWRDDSVECNLLFGQGAGAHRVQVAVNAAGVMFDSIDGDKAANLNVTVKTASDEEGWSLAIGIPFAEMKAKPPSPGEAWVVNFFRGSSLPEKSSWAPLLKTFDETGRFGRMVFGADGGPAVRLGGVPRFSSGENTVVLASPLPGPCWLEGRDERNCPLKDSLQCVQEAGAVVLTLADDRVRSVAMTVSDKRGEPVFRAAYPVESPPVATRMERVRGKMAIVEKTLPKFPAALRAKAGDVLAKAKASADELAREMAAPGRREPAAWKAMDAKLAAVELGLDGAHALAKTLAWSAGVDYAVGWESSMRKVLIRDHAFAGRFGERYDLSLAGNEHEGCQVVLMPFEADLRDATVKVGGLRDRGGRAFKGKVEVSLVGHVKVAEDTPYEVDYRGWWPDPLLDYQSACDVKAGEHVAFWIDVAAAPDAAAGDYEAPVTVSASGVRPVTLKLGVKVWPFSLPNETHLRNAFTYNQPAVGRFYRDRWNSQMARRYQDFLLDHRIGPDHLYHRGAPDLEMLQHACARGMNAFNVGSAFHRNPGDQPSPEQEKYIQRLKDLGIFDRAYVYGFDEVKAEKYAEMRKVFGEVHRKYPGLETMTTAQDPSFGRKSGLREVVDIWVPTTDQYNMAEAEALRKEGREMWWYICVVPTHPYANWFVESPAIEARLLTGTMSYKYKAGGFLYYLVNLWDVNRHPIGKGPYTDWNPGSFVNDKKKYTANGDGSLFCPGPDGPVSTIRLENIRDGFEDYEYLYMLAEQAKVLRANAAKAEVKAWLAKADALLAVPAAVVDTVTNYTREPGELEACRASMAEAIQEGLRLRTP